MEKTDSLKEILTYQKKKRSGLSPAGTLPDTTLYENEL